MPVVKFYEPKMHEFLNSNKSGDRRTLWTYLESRIKITVMAAKAQVGVKTGALRSSIFGFHLGDAKGQSYGVRATRPYALVHHNGSRPHKMEIIRPSGKSRVLVSRTIMHPGTKPNRYLSDNIHLMGEL